jgi:hypothetical protein
MTRFERLMRAYGLPLDGQGLLKPEIGDIWLNMRTHESYVVTSGNEQAKQEEFKLHVPLDPYYITSRITNDEWINNMERLWQKK